MGQRSDIVNGCCFSGTVGPRASDVNVPAGDRVDGDDIAFAFLEAREGSMDQGVEAYNVGLESFGPTLCTICH